MGLSNENAAESWRIRRATAAVARGKIEKTTKEVSPLSGEALRGDKGSWGSCRGTRGRARPVGRGFASKLLSPVWTRMMCLVRHPPLSTAWKYQADPPYSKRSIAIAKKRMSLFRGGRRCRATKRLAD